MGKTGKFIGGFGREAKSREGGGRWRDWGANRTKREGSTTVGGRRIPKEPLYNLCREIADAEWYRSLFSAVSQSRRRNC